MKAWTRAPIRSACWRVHLVAGVERTFFWGIVLAAALAGGLGWLAGAWYVLLAILPATFAALELLRRATIEDPMASRVWWRWVREPSRVVAVGRFDRRSNGRGRR